MHKHGPCSHLSKPKGANHNTPSHDHHLNTLLKKDQTRVNWIRSRLQSRGKKGSAGRQRLPDAVIPANAGDAMGTGDYIVTVGLGTPKKQLSLVFDTGSALTWTQCEPCVRQCYSQKEPIFQPSQSSSYSNVSCDSDLCSQLESTTGHLLVVYRFLFYPSISCFGIKERYVLCMSVKEYYS